MVMSKNVHAGSQFFIGTDTKPNTSLQAAVIKYNAMYRGNLANIHGGKSSEPGVD